MKLPLKKPVAILACAVLILSIPCPGFYAAFAASNVGTVSSHLDKPAASNTTPLKTVESHAFHWFLEEAIPHLYDLSGLKSLCLADDYIPAPEFVQPSEALLLVLAGPGDYSPEIRTLRQTNEEIKFLHGLKEGTPRFLEIQQKNFENLDKLEAAAKYHRENQQRRDEIRAVQAAVEAQRAGRLASLMESNAALDGLYSGAGRPKQTGPSGLEFIDDVRLVSPDKVNYKLPSDAAAELRQLRQHDYVPPTAIGSDGYLYSVVKHTIFRWNLSTGKPSTVITQEEYRNKFYKDHPDPDNVSPISVIAIAPSAAAAADGQNLVDLYLGSGQKISIIQHLPTGEAIYKSFQVSSEVLSMMIQEAELFVGASNNQIGLFNRNIGSPIGLAEHMGPVQEIARTNHFLYGASVIKSSADKGSVLKRWGKTLEAIIVRKLPFSITSLDRHPDGLHVLMVSDDDPKSIKVWDAAQFKQVLRIQIDSATSSPIRKVAADAAYWVVEYANGIMRRIAAPEIWRTHRRQLHPPKVETAAQGVGTALAPAAETIGLYKPALPPIVQDVRDTTMVSPPATTKENDKSSEIPSEESLLMDARGDLSERFVTKYLEAANNLREHGITLFTESLIQGLRNLHSLEPISASEAAILGLLKSWGLIGPDETQLIATPGSATDAAVVAEPDFSSNVAASSAAPTETRERRTTRLPRRTRGPWARPDQRDRAMGRMPKELEDPGDIISVEKVLDLIEIKTVERQPLPRNLTGWQVIRTLTQAGFGIVRRSGGSHVQLRRSQNGEFVGDTVTVAARRGVVVDVLDMRSILRQAHMSAAEFNDFYNDHMAARRKKNPDSNGT